LATGNPLLPAIAWLRDLQAKGELDPLWLELGIDDLWVAVRDGRCRAALALYSQKRRHPQIESFDLEWLPFPSRPGRKNFSVGAVILAAEIPATAWNVAGARGAAARLLGNAEQEAIGKGNSLVPLGRGVPNFDRETRDARIGLSVAPVFVLPSSDRDLPEGWSTLLSAVREELAR
ncbi:MAG: hypothetical protein Q8M76_12320, partial [Spirochaetaceae bacterium]|nr:hypothetical protein [Spirochaetaceae bacterium]